MSFPYRSKRRDSDTAGNSRGFTLIEVLIAVLIIGLFLAAAAGLAGRMVKISISLEYDEIAMHLAQEGIEFVRNRRDTNRINNLDWMDGLRDPVSPCGTPLGCKAELDSSTGAITFVVLTGACPPTCEYIRFNPATGVYSYEMAGTPTSFVRTINMDAIAADEVRVVATVAWDTLFGSKTFVITEHLLNWQ